MAAAPRRGGITGSFGALSRRREKPDTTFGSLGRAARPKPGVDEEVVDDEEEFHKADA